MKWEEVRKLYPNQFVKLKVFQSHIEGNKKIIEDVAVIKAFDTNRGATYELFIRLAGFNGFRFYRY